MYLMEYIEMIMLNILYIWEIITTSLRPHWKSWLIRGNVPKWP